MNTSSPVSSYMLMSLLFKSESAFVGWRHWQGRLHVSRIAKRSVQDWCKPGLLTTS